NRLCVCDSCKKQATNTQPALKPTPQTTSQTNSESPPIRPTCITIIQININGILSKIQELTILAKQLKADIILIQETKLNTKNKTPNITGYTSIRKDRTTEGGGLMTYIKNHITIKELSSDPNSTQTPIKNQSFKIHLT